MGTSLQKESRSQEDFMYMCLSKLFAHSFPDVLINNYNTRLKNNERKMMAERKWGPGQSSISPQMIETV